MKELMVISLFVLITWSHPVMEDATVDSLENSSQESMESTESSTIIALNENKTMASASKNLTRVALVRPVVVWPLHYPFFRTSPYHYQPYHLSPLVRSNMQQTDDYSDEEAQMMARNPFPIDDELSEEEALKELEAIRKEMAEDAAAKLHEERLILPSITINPEQSSVTVSLKSFASFLRSFSSRVTVTLATRTILVPNVSIKN